MIRFFIFSVLIFGNACMHSDAPKGAAKDKPETIEQHTDQQGIDQSLELDLSEEELLTKCSKYKIVGFGEPQHWVTNPQIFRIELFKKLHIKYGWNYFFTETHLFVASMVDSYINGLIDKPEKLSSYLMSSFRLPEMFEFIEWTRQQNKQLPLNKRIHILGWDGQETNWTYKKHPRKKLIENFSRLVTKFFPRFDIKKIEKLYEQIGKMKFDRSDFTKWANTRDKNSFSIMKEFIRVLPNEHFFLIGHNGHITFAQYSWGRVTYLGHHLHNNYKYLSIGSDILSGSIIKSEQPPFLEVKIFPRQDKQSHDVRVIIPTKTTKHITLDQPNNPKLMSTYGRHDILVRFKKDKPSFIKSIDKW